MHDDAAVFDLARVPFSRFGSWMAKGLRGGNRLILKNVHNRGHDLFQLTPMANGAAVDYAVTMTATLPTLATEHPESPSYERDGYWRGPIWGPSTYIAVCGMERCGHPDLAREISWRFCALCDRSGFAENLDALTGEPSRDPACTWAASAFLLMLKRIGLQDEGTPDGRRATARPREADDVGAGPVVQERGVH